MQRPIMNPMFLDDAESSATTKQSARTRVFGLVRWVGRALLMDICFWQGAGRLQVEDGTPIGRIARGMLYRLAFVPVAFALVAAVLVWIGTHPPTSFAAVDPQTRGIHFVPVSFVSSDGANLNAWLVPVLDPKLILEKKEKFLRTKFPAVVLAHDYGSARDQMLPLVQPLHDAGYAVLVVGLRGNSPVGSKGCAFGLRERADVQAAVELLRNRGGIDPARIAVLGIGTGANAALLAAERDPAIAAVILDQPATDLSHLFSEYIGPSQTWLQWMKPLCKWTFELAYRVDAEELDSQRNVLLGTRPILVLNSSRGSPQCFRQAGMNDIKGFLARHFVESMEGPATVNVDVKELR